MMHAEIGAHEIEIETETERPPSPEEILPDIKTKTTTIPPLRPLTIAPKPTKVPIAMKTMQGGQQLLLLGTGGNQQIKLVSSGQELNFANLTLGRPVAIKPAMKTITTQASNIQLVQPKPMVMKKIVTTNQKSAKGFTTKPGHIMVVQKTDHAKPLTTLPTPTKTITLQQAQEMGLISTNAKIISSPQAQSTPKHTLVLNKSKAIKLVPQPMISSLGGQKSQIQIKSPTKILPATSTTSTGKAPQRFIFKSSAGGHTILPSAQIIQVAGGQALNTGQLHQINIPGKGVSWVLFISVIGEFSN